MGRLSRAVFVSVIAAAAAADVVLLRRGVETDLFSIVGRAGVLSEISSAGANAVRVLCADAATAAKCRKAFPFDAPFDGGGLLELVRTHGRGLLSARDRELLLRGDVDRVRRGVARRDFSGVGMFSKEDDPDYFLSGFVTSLASLRPPELDEGMELAAGAFDGSPGAEAGLRRLVAIAREDAGVWLSGAAFHTLLATDRARAEISALGMFSLAVVFLLGWMLFGNLRFAVPLALALACGFAAGAASQLLLPGRPHALTFLFGTTLVGLGVDYCYHAMGAGGDRGFPRRLFAALSTTCLSFLPLAFSRVAVLRQMAVFTVSGLAATFAFSVLFAPRFAPARAKDPGPRGRSPASARIAAYATVLAATAALFCALARGVAFSHDPALLHSPDPVMASGEAKFASLFGDGGRLAVVPLARWQEENAALKSTVETLRGEFLSAGDLPPWLVGRIGGEDCLVLPESAAEAVVGTSSGSVCRKVDLRAELAALFREISREAGRLLAFSLALLLAGLAAACGRGFVKVACPVAAAGVATFATLAAAGAQITFFHVVSFFIMAGIGVDYSIFHLSCARGASVPPPVRRTVFFSFLTSFAGFASLALTSFPATRFMGATLAAGILYSYAFSLFLLPSGRDVGGRRSGRTAVAVAWWIYRAFGKAAARAAVAAVFIFVYPFCRRARAALKGYYRAAGVPGRPFRHVLGFVLSLVDKTDACSLCRYPPAFRCEGDLGWTEGGCFILSSHLGCIEVLPALRPERGAVPLVHAFRQMRHGEAFTGFFAGKTDRSRIVVHATEEIGVETAVEMKDAIARGEIVVMAGDRLPAAGRGRVVERPFFGRVCRWPCGVFRFARLMECPVYAVVCARTGRDEYTVVSERLPAGGDLPGGYVRFLERQTRRHPYQWYHFHPFFGAGDSARAIWYNSSEDEKA